MVSLVSDTHGVHVFHGDCLDVLLADENGYDHRLGYGTGRLIADDSMDSIVTDPPYGLSAPPDVADVLGHWMADEQYNHVGGGFMNAAWDSFVPGPLVWKECFRVLKPGGHMLVFAGSRTHDLMGMAIRLAGFEIRDSIMWLCAQGFPKSVDLAKSVGKRHPERGREFTGWGTSLKPAQEPITVARKPFVGTVADNVVAHGVGGLNIDATRVQMSQSDRDAINAKHAGMNPDTYQRAAGVSLNLSVNPMALKKAEAHDLGRFPTNVVMSHAPECVDTAAGPACVPGCPVRELDAQSGRSVSRKGREGRGKVSRRGDAVFGDMSSGLSGRSGREYDDAGGASRFFPVFRFQQKATRAERPVVGGVAHTTVKPLELMRWMVRLVTPAGGVVFDPFAGSGTTAEAALLEGVGCVTVEREAAHVPLVLARVARSAPFTGEVLASSGALGGVPQG